MAFVQLNWKPNSRELRQFGAIFLIGFLLIGLTKIFWPWPWLFSRNETAGAVFILVGLVVGVIGLTGTRAALPFYWTWLGIAYVMGNVIGRAIIVAIYLAIIMPLGLLSSLTERDKLQLKKPDTDSYWKDISLPQEPEKYERQF